MSGLVVRAAGPPHTPSSHSFTPNSPPGQREDGGHSGVQRSRHQFPLREDAAAKGREACSGSPCASPYGFGLTLLLANPSSQAGSGKLTLRIPKKLASNRPPPPSRPPPPRSGEHEPGLRDAYGNDVYENDGFVVDDDAEADDLSMSRGGEVVPHPIITRVL